MSIVSDYVLERYNAAARKSAQEAQVLEKERAMKLARMEEVDNAEANLNLVVEDNKKADGGRRGSALAKQRIASGAMMSTLVGGLVAVNKVRTQSLSFGRDNGGGGGKEGLQMVLENKKNMSSRQLAKEMEKLQQIQEEDEQREVSGAG